MGYISVEDLAKFFQPFEKVLDEFVQSKGLECEKWLKDGPLIHFGLLGTNRTNINVSSTRRLVDVHIHPELRKVFIAAGASSDMFVRTRYKTIYLFGDDVSRISPSKFRHWLDISWRVALSIQPSDLLSVTDWENDNMEQRTTLDLPCTCF